MHYIQRKSSILRNSKNRRVTFIGISKDKWSLSSTELLLFRLLLFISRHFRLGVSTSLSGVVYGLKTKVVTKTASTVAIQSKRREIYKINKR